MNATLAVLHDKLQFAVLSEDKERGENDDKSVCRAELSRGAVYARQALTWNGTASLYHFAGNHELLNTLL